MNNLLKKYENTTHGYSEINVKKQSKVILHFKNNNYQF